MDISYLHEVQEYVQPTLNYIGSLSNKYFEPIVTTGIVGPTIYAWYKVFASDMRENSELENKIED